MQGCNNLIFKMKKNSQKVVIISAWLPGGGIEKVIQNLYLEESPFVDLIVLSLSTKINYNWYSKFEDRIQFIDCFNEKSNVFGTLISFLRSIVIVNRYIKKESPKVILFSHSFLLPIFGILKPKCQTLFWPQNSLNVSSNFIRSFLTKMNYSFFRKSIKGVLCVNETIEKEAKSHGFKKTYMVYNPIGESFPPQFKFDPSLNKLVHIGFLDSRKNTSFIIEAMAQTRNHNLTLDIIGSGELLNQLIKLAEDLGISEKINFRGFVDLKNEMINCSGLIMASKSEGFSMIISDALKCGVPVILPENLDIYRFIKTNKALGSGFRLNELSSIVDVLDNINFETIDTNLISNTYIKEFGSLAYHKRLIKALL